MDWSSEQQAIFEYVLTATGHLVIVARAGSGKSTSLAESIKRYSKANPHHYILACAFMTRVRDELIEKVAGIRNVTVWTYNQLGFWFVRNTWRGIRVDTDKGWACARAAVVEADKINARRPMKRMLTALPGLDSSSQQLEQRSEPDESWVERVAPLARLARHTLPGSIADLAKLCIKHGFSDEEHDATTIATITARAMQLSIENTKVCDLDDQTYLPVAYDLSCPRPFDIVFGDELQDCDRAQLWLLQRAARQDGGRVIGCGDNFQSCFAFRGADSESIDTIVETLEAPTLPLTTSYRCAHAVIREAQRYVKDINAAPWAIEGEVLRTSNPQYDDQTRPNVMNAQHGDAVISRTNAALVPVCFGLIQMGKRAVLTGRDPGRLLSAVKRTRARSTRHLIDSMYASREERVAEALASEQKQLAREIADEYDTIIAIARRCSTIDDVMEQIRSVFVKSGIEVDAASVVTCTSTHRGKGLEWQNVWILGPTFNDVDQEELNLQYIAVTRAKNRVVWVGDPEHIEDEQPSGQPMLARTSDALVASMATMTDSLFREADVPEELPSERRERVRDADRRYVKKQLGFGWEK